MWCGMLSGLVNLDNCDSEGVVRVVDGFLGSTVVGMWLVPEVVGIYV